MGTRYIVEVSREGNSWQCFSTTGNYVEAEKAFTRAKDQSAAYLREGLASGAGAYRFFRIREVLDKVLYSSRMDISFMEVKA